MAGIGTTSLVPAKTKKDGTMEEYQFRVIQERVQLEQRLDRLKAFIDNDAFLKVFWRERIRMRSQVQFMELYLSVLKQRIKYFSEEDV